MQFEATRTDPAPDADALRLAASHAQHACRLSPDLAEAWATLGFVLERTGRRDDALAALGRAVTLEPDNWRHQVRLSLGSWGETRLRSARRALAECPHLPLAHWLAASVFVARDALDRAEREVDSGLGVAAVESHEAAPFSVVALHWLKGLLCLARGAADEAHGVVRSRAGARSARTPLFPRGRREHLVREGGVSPRPGRSRGRPRRRSAKPWRGCPAIRWRTPGSPSWTTIPSSPLRILQRPGPSIWRWPSAARLAWAGDVPGAVRIVTAALGCRAAGQWRLALAHRTAPRRAARPRRLDAGARRASPARALTCQDDRWNSAHSGLFSETGRTSPRPGRDDAGQEVSS